MFNTGRSLILASMFALALSLLARGEEKVPIEQLPDKDYISTVQAELRQLVSDVEDLQAEVVAELSGQKERELYHRVDAVLGQAVHLQNSLKAGVSRRIIYSDFDKLDVALHDLMKALQGIGSDHASLQRSAARIQRRDDQLHFVVSAGDTSDARARQTLRRQAEALTRATSSLEKTASYALSNYAAEGGIQGAMTKLVAATKQFQSRVEKGADRTMLRESFVEVNRAWEQVTQGLIALQPRENVYLLRIASQVDQLHDRMHHILGIEGKRSGLIIRT